MNLSTLPKLGCYACNIVLTTTDGTVTCFMCDYTIGYTEYFSRLNAMTKLRDQMDQLEHEELVASLTPLTDEERDDYAAIDEQRDELRLKDWSAA